MQKWLGIIIAVIVFLVVGFFALNSYIYNEKQGDGGESMENTNSSNTNENSLQITPISHATMVL